MLSFTPKQKEYSISLKISQAIHDGKWLNLLYKNQDNEEKQFWAAVTNLKASNRSIMIDVFMFNPTINSYDNPIKNATIHFENILDASVVDYSIYEVPEELIQKIKTDSEIKDWLNYDDLEVNKIMLYLRDCLKNNESPLVEPFLMLEGIDKSSFDECSEIALSKENYDTIKEILSNNKDVNSKKKDVTNYTFINLAFNVLSIKTQNGIIPLVYQEVNFNPKKLTLSLSKVLTFSNSVLSGREKKYKVSNNNSSKDNFSIENDIIPVSADDFISLFKKNRREATELLKKNVYYGKIVNENPYFMQLNTHFTVDISSECESVANMLKTNSLTEPLNAFMGRKFKLRNRNKPNVVTYDENINIDQARVVFDSMRESVTYVEGPPGTGKTQTLLNVIMSAFFNDKSCLICSGNNTPVDGIIDKLSNDNLPHERLGEIIFPYIRIGNASVQIETIKRLRKIFEFIQDRNVFEDITRITKNSALKNYSELREVLARYETYTDNKENLETLTKWKTNTNSVMLKSYIENVEKKIKSEYKEEDKNISDEIIKKLCKNGKQDYNFQNYLYYHSLEHLKKLSSYTFKPLREIISINDDKTAIKKFEEYLADDDNLKKLLEVFPFFASTNISAKKIGSAVPHFDLCIMDESGQCDIGTSLIPIIRATNLLLVGDVKQLQPIVKLTQKKDEELLERYNIQRPEIYDFRTHSILKLMEKTDTLSKKIMLHNHYRCGEVIADFSNRYYYDGDLNIKSGFKGEVNFIDVNNVSKIDKNTYEEECNKTVEAIKKYKEKCIAQNEKVDIAVITPFKNNAYAINKKLKESGETEIVANTVHSVQGMEHDTIIMSLSLAEDSNQGTFDWIKDNQELINVGITRAKKNFTLIGNYEAIKKFSRNSDNKILDLSNYTRSKGIVSDETKYPIKNNYSNGSFYEKQFFETINQIISQNKKVEIKRNVSLKEVFLNYDISSLNDAEKTYLQRAEFDVVLYEKNKKQMIAAAIEIDGNEHYRDEGIMQRDQKKESIYKKLTGRDIIRVKNQDVASYEMLKEIINSYISYDKIQQKFYF